MAPQQIKNLDIKATLESKVKEEIHQRMRIPLLSANIRGSYHHALRGEEPFSDEIDLYFIINKDRLEEQDFDCITKFFKDWAEDLTGSDREGYRYMVETRIGPFKPETNKTFQFHLLLDDKTACEKIIPTVRLNWMMASTKLLGIPLREVDIFRSSKLTRRMIVGKNCYGGIHQYIQQINDDTIYYKEWGTKEGSFGKQNMAFHIETPHARRTFLEYCCLISLQNTIRYLEHAKNKPQRKQHKQHKPHEEFYPSRENILAASREYLSEQVPFIEELVQRKAFPPNADDYNTQKAIDFLQYLALSVPEVE